MSPSQHLAPAAPAAGSAPLSNRLLRALLHGVAMLASALAMPTASSAAIWPTEDPFYTPPADLAAHPNGTVLRSRPTRIRTAPGIKQPFKAYQVLYRTTDRQEKPIATVATIISPLQKAPGAPKLVSYQTAYDGLSAACLPSWSLQTGKVALQGAETLIMLGLLARGWTVVTADYEGPEHAWLTAKTTGRGVLDGIRAAQGYAPAGLTEGAKTPVGMMGYSGGGQATAWASEMRSTYAPELNIIGSAQGGVAADMSQVLRSMDGQFFSGIALAGIAGIAKGYPELKFDEYLNNRGKYKMRQLRSYKGSCIMDFALAHPFVKLRSLTKVDIMSRPEFKAVGEEISLGKHSPETPMFMYHTVLDQMDGYESMVKLVRRYCKDATPVQFVTGYKEEHAMQAFSMPFKAQNWMAERFAGKPMVSNCDHYPT